MDTSIGKRGIYMESNTQLKKSLGVMAAMSIVVGCVIGAGSVVTRDIPPNSLAVGNPCRVLRTITEADRLSAHPEWFE